MNDPLKLFAKLSCHLEDLHSLAAEAQCADQPAEMIHILAEQSCNELQRCRSVLDQINSALGAS